MNSSSTCAPGETTRPWAVLGRYSPTQNAFGSLVDTSDFTVAFWFNVLDMPMSSFSNYYADPCGLFYAPTIWEEASSGVPMFRVQIYMSQLRITPFYVGVTVTGSYSVDISNHHWYHVAIRWSWSYQTLYFMVDGVSIGSMQVVPCISLCDTPVATGYNTPATGNIYNTQWPGWGSFTASYTGLFDRLFMFNKYVSDLELQSLMNYHGNFVRPVNLPL